jgi:hypothetical protein
LVLDEITAISQRADLDVRASIERVVGQFLQDQPAQLGGSHTGLLLETFDGPE